jgi:DHA1 family tetracycline resistance protein-like MFS transporter
VEKTLKKQLFLIFGFVFIDLLGYSLILPLLPFYADTFGASLSVVGLLGAVNAFAQMLAAPTIGRLSDRYGRRPLLIFSIAGTLLSFLLLGFAGSLLMLFFSRILDGVLGGNVALARAYITDVTDDQNRAKSLGIIGAAFGLGFIFGPALGGFLSQWGFAVPAFVAAGLSLINLVLVIWQLPESLPPEQRKVFRTSQKTAFNLSNLLNELRRPCIGSLLTIQLIYGLAFTLFTANFSLFALKQLGLTAQSTSYVLTYVGFLSVLVQGGAIGFLTKRFKERSLIFVTALTLIVALFIWGVINDLIWMLVIITPIAVSAGVLNTLLTSQLTKAVFKEDVGGTLGLSASLQTLAQVVAPLIGGVMLDFLGGWSLGSLSSLLMVATSFMIYRYLVRQPELSGPCTRPDEVAV